MNDTAATYMTLEGFEVYKTIEAPQVDTCGVDA